MSDDCTCIMLAAQTPWEPADWEQADDCPIHPLRSEGNCTRKGCGRPFTEHDYGIFCP